MRRIFSYEINYNSSVASNLQHLNFIEKVKYFVISDIHLGLSWFSNLLHEEKQNRVYRLHDMVKPILKVELRVENIMTDRLRIR